MDFKAILARSCDTLKKDAILAVNFVSSRAIFLASSELVSIDFPILIKVDPV